MPFTLKPSDFADEEHYQKYLKRQQDAPLTEECRKYPAGRNKTLVIKTVRSKSKPRKRNDRRLCLVNIVSNPENIKLVALKQADRNYSLWLYPEGRRVNSNEELSLASSFLAWRKFRKIRKSLASYTPEEAKAKLKKWLNAKSIEITDKKLVDATNNQLERLVKKYGGDGCVMKRANRFVFTDQALVNATNYQLKRIIRRYSKYLDEYSGGDDDENENEKERKTDGKKEISHP